MGNLSSIASSLSLAAAIALLAPGVSAYAQTDREPGPRRVVRYADLDLDRAADVAELYGRIRNAAKQVCWIQEASSVQRRLRTQACVNAVTANTVARVDHDSLTNYHLTQNGAKRADVGVGESIASTHD
jgi:UrcA family protein